MKKILFGLLSALMACAAHAAVGDLREIKLGSGATQYQILVPFPAAGTKCIRYMDGASGVVIPGAGATTLGCWDLGAGFSIVGNTINATGGAPGPAGADGKSAYQVAVDNGYLGTQPQWLISLKGDPGSTGATGPAGPPGTTTWAGITDKPAVIVEGDSRLTDARTPTAHTHTAAQISDSTTTGRSLLMATDAATARAAISAAAQVHTHVAADITDSTTTGRSVLTAASAAAARSAIGAGVSNFDGSYPSLTGIPATFAPAAHTQAFSTITSTPTTCSGYGITDCLTTSAAAAAYYPLGSNPAGYLTGISSAQVTAALGFTPYNATNPAGYLTSVALAPYLQSATAASTYATQAALSSGLAGKFNTPTGTTAQYLDGTGALRTFPTIPTVPVINRTIATTATDGTYTWTLPTACGSGQLPIVSVTPENNTSAEVINHKITAKSNTSVTIALSRAILTLNGLLGLTLPIIQTTPGAQTVHLIAICP